MKVVDLSLLIEEGSVTFPGLQKAVILEHVTHKFSAPRYKLPCKGFASYQLILNDHTGTHIDAPFHMCPDKGKLETVKLEKLVGEAVLMDFSHLPVEIEITSDELEKLVGERGIEVKKGDIVVIRKWPGKWGEEGYFKCKALDESGAQWLVDKKINALAIDLPTVDVEDPPLERRAHIKLLSNDIYILENLVNLDRINRERFTFAALPLNIKGISGSPTRAIAIL
jgi:kynurenine formamidase